MSGEGYGFHKIPGEKKIGLYEISVEDLITC